MIILLPENSSLLAFFGRYKLSMKGDKTDISID